MHWAMIPTYRNIKIMSTFKLLCITCKVLVFSLPQWFFNTKDSSICIIALSATIKNFKVHSNMRTHQRSQLFDHCTSSLQQSNLQNQNQGFRHPPRLNTEANQNTITTQTFLVSTPKYMYYTVACSNYEQPKGKNLYHRSFLVRVCSFAEKHTVIEKLWCLTGWTSLQRH